jgi:hypothetical protein
MSLIKKIRNTGLALILSAGIMGCDGCTQKNNELIELNVSENGPNWMMYAGMNSESSFSLAYGGNVGANMYYPKSSEIINFNNEKYDVISVTPEKIILKQSKK